MIAYDEIHSIFCESTGKLWRQRLYYLRAADRFMLGLTPENAPVKRAVAASLRKCADDMKFLFEKMTGRIPDEMREAIREEATLRFERGYASESEWPTRP